jgi:hypothetical protein
MKKIDLEELSFSDALAPGQIVNSKPAGKGARRILNQ